MLAWFASPLRRLWPYLAAAGAAVSALGAAYLRGRSDARAKADLRATKREAAALEERLEMNREATDIERKAGELSDEEAQREAMTWAKR
ncbi:hypothetical protein [Arvimicrobium flavum]|uniref:hypothetical protein n=1 Tax=Arvimicrobium flavum TaxID=3393320 RepID=UPI00237AA76B|nr:hypothetical protein [Mesorhizobium shangrilense]